ncbi:MAG: hypothetical protein AAFQ98_10995, partial [Bacteroidota bacterium]
MRKLSMLAAGFLLHGMAMAQPFLIHRADSLKEAGDLVQSFLCYRMVHSNAPTEPQYAYELAQIAALMYSPQAADTSFYYLEKALALDSSIQVLMDPQLYYLTTDARWAALEQNQVAKYEAAHGQLPYPDFARALWDMIRRDQALRFFHRPMERQIREGSPTPPILYPLTYMGVEIRAQNLPALEDWVARYGWPKRSEFPDETADVAALI